MESQQRLLLEVSYEACESAGVMLNQLRGSQMSIHVRSISNNYSVIQARGPETIPKYNTTVAHTPRIITNRAVQGLRVGDCDAAIVGRTNLIMDPGPYIAESKLRMLSPESQCRMWDTAANGYGRGEGMAG
ncbi:Polyketide synthase-nonribosomal peptide synthetase [Colletotrichum tanaceti]|uniref:Polyketide synthase-nonribosomal peptide synthetase n=1 Tax=Colletotrichum tanaceti TaxID=1306861 RepID=A0A4U6X456_9PEZI|nr:Polyketide synthase-nonribosomal peptide synthetase [Colletotrichum tanaceti]